MEQEGTLSRHLTGRRSFSRDPSKTDKLSHRVDQATPLQWAGRYINLSSKPEYFAILSLIARSAAAPASLAVAATIRISHHDTYTVVTSQARGLPPFQGTSVRPSGRLPSDRTKPCGSLELAIPAEVKLLLLYCKI